MPSELTVVISEHGSVAAVYPMTFSPTKKLKIKLHLEKTWLIWRNFLVEQGHYHCWWANSAGFLGVQQWGEITQVGEHCSSPDKKYWCVQPHCWSGATHSLSVVEWQGSVNKILHSICVSMSRVLGNPAASSAWRASQQPWILGQKAHAHAFLM